jgi:acyl carrier protein
MVERQEIVDSVTERLGDVFAEGNGIRVDESTDLRDIPGFDSLGILELLVWLEEKYGVAVPDDELVVEDFCSVAKIADFVMAHTGTGQPR